MDNDPRRHQGSAGRCWLLKGQRFE